MSMCPKGTKKMVRPRGKGKDHVKRGRKGHSWEKLIENGLHIGRVCRNCGKKVLSF